MQIKDNNKCLSSVCSIQLSPCVHLFFFLVSRGKRVFLSNFVGLTTSEKKIISFLANSAIILSYQMILRAYWMQRIQKRKKNLNI